MEIGFLVKKKEMDKLYLLMDQFFMENGKMTFLMEMAK